MKPDLDKMNNQEKQLILEALFRLKYQNNDFQLILNFLESGLENRKTMLISSEPEYIQRIQGEAEVLKGLFDIIATAEQQHRK
ncbi:hypothetical protein ACNO5M_13385 [Vibrio owensii]|uniref:hypothetical protein n=1 Tax=Vibrio owensii TaxID=696485 RepID=UPI003AACF334